MSERLLGFLEEDVSVEWLDAGNSVLDGLDAEGVVVTNEAGVVAGLHEARVLYEELGVRVKGLVSDGEEVESGMELMRLEGSAELMLRGERLALNIIGCMSGVATATRECVEEADVVVAGTRKTTPGFRSFEKKAVKVGGGDPHRYNLEDAVIIKDNHIELLGLREAIERVRSEVSFSRLVEVEVESVEGAETAASMGVDVVMLDNMDPDTVEKAVEVLSEYDVVVEASGGISRTDIKDYAKAGVDVVSVGGLVRSSEWLDVSMSV